MAGHTPPADPPSSRPWSRRIATDLVLAGAFLRNGGIGRAVLVAGCTAMVSGLLFVALTVLLYTVATPAGLGGGREAEILGGLVHDANVRAGYLTGILLITLAPLTLLRQVLRLGTAAREQRLAGLRLAGATPADVRRLARMEVGLPAFVGALTGYLLFLGLRAVFGGVPRDDIVFADYDPIFNELRLIPTTVSPTWWHVVLVAIAVGLGGAFAGAAATRRVHVTPLGVSRREPGRPPRPWAALGLFVLGLAGLGYTALGARAGSSTVVGIATVVLVVAGLLMLTPWLAYTAGRVVVARASTAHVLLAGRRLVTDPRPAGRAAAAIGVIGLVAGFGSVIVTDLPSSSGMGQGFRGVEPFYTVPSVLVALVLVLSLALIVFSLAVHGAETLMDSKRAIASLAAAGATEVDLVRAQRWEVGLVAVPVTVAGLALGTVPALVALSADGTIAGAYAWIPVAANLATAGCALLAVLLATTITRPWLRRASSAANLRTT